MNEFFIQALKYKQIDKGVVLQIIFKRELFGMMIKIHFSTILINVVGQATMYLDSEQHFEVIIATNITCVTVLASLFILITTMIPATSYLKMIDFWLLLNLYYPCCLIILHIFIQKSKSEEKIKTNVRVFTEKEQPKTNGMFSYKKYEIGSIVGKIVFPFCGSLCVFGYLFIGLENWYSEVL